MMSVVRVMTLAVSTASPIGSTLSAYDFGAFHSGTCRDHGPSPRA